MLDHLGAQPRAARRAAPQTYHDRDKKPGSQCTSGAIPGRVPSPSPSPSPAPPSPPVPPAPAPAPAPANAKNVLMILVDDLRPQLGAYNISVGEGQMMQTPHIDRLAKRGMVFKHAYNQYAVCSPSRNSFLSGRRPDTTLTYNFKDSFRTAPGGATMTPLPEYFKLHGVCACACACVCVARVVVYGWLCTLHLCAGSVSCARSRWEAVVPRLLSWCEEVHC